MSQIPTDTLNFFIDLDRYPIHDLTSKPGKALIASAHEMMATDTLVMFPGFLSPGCSFHLADELNQLQHSAHRIEYDCTMYGWMDNSGFPPEHPRSTLLRRNCGVVTTELVPERGPTRDLFHCDELTEFVRRMLRYDTLYRSVCPTLAIQVNTMAEGESFGWHFDTNDGVVSFTIQNADSGGGFEYAPLIRDEDDENYAGIERLISGAEAPRKPNMTPGTLSLFLGRRSLHRVAPVGSTTQQRLSLLYSYDRDPDMVFPPSSRERMQGGSGKPYRGVSTPSLS